MKSKLSLLLLVLILFSITIISIGYASYNTQLMISGEAVVSPDKGIKVTNVELLSAVDGGYETYSSNYVDNTSELFISLPNQNSSITFSIEITNNSYNKFYLKNIDELIYSNENISYEILNSELLFFEPNTVSTLEIRFYYDESIDSVTDLVADFRYNFVEANFTTLEYLTSTGVQYIDTGVMNTKDLIFESEYKLVNKAKGEGVWLFSGRKITQHTVGLYFYMSITTYNYIINSYGGNTAPYTTVHLPKDTWYDMYFSRTGMSINSVNIPVTTKLLVPESAAASILLGANIVNWDGSIDTRYFEGDIKYFKMTDAVTKEVVRNFIPVKLDDTGEVGYFDLVEAKFYSNIGTGEFLAP